MLSVAKRALAGQRILPYDAEVEYIGVGATTGPFIDTGYRWTTDNIKIDIELMRTGTPAPNTGLFGSQKVGVDTNWGIQFWQGGVRVFHYIGSSGNVYYWDPTTGQKIHFIGETTASHTWSITIDGVEHTGSWAGTVCQDVTTIGLFTLYNNLNMTTRRTNNVNVYSFKLTDNGVLVRDLVPVRVGSVGYMYDRVSGKLFGNEGTGAFTVGPDIWKNPYVTDGLVAMWDGEWNAGGGKHDANIRLVDITGVAPTIEPNNIENFSAVFTSAATVPMTQGMIDAWNATTVTVEIVFQANSRSTGVMSARGTANTDLVWNNNFYVRTISNVGSILNAPLQVDTDYHVAFTRATNSAKLYLNGISSGDGTWNNTTASNNNIQIRYSGGIVKMKSLRIYSRVLTAEEIAANYAIDKARFGLP